MQRDAGGDLHAALGKPFARLHVIVGGEAHHH